MWVRFPPGVPSTEGGSDRRTHPISGLLASLSLARCTNFKPTWVVGRADMQPPFKRRDPGSTPGRPTNFWAFGRTVMHLPLKKTDVGSTPTAPTKDAPVTQLADVSGLKLEFCEFDSRRGYCGDRALFGSAVSSAADVECNSHLRYQSCWCGSTAEQSPCKRWVAGSTPVTCSRCRRGVTGNTGAWYAPDMGSNPII